MRRYIIAHWRGELSLAQSFLVNGVVGYFVLTAGFIGFGLFFVSRTYIYAGFIGICVWQIWAAVGIARCALRMFREPGATLAAAMARRGSGVVALVVTALVVYGSVDDVRLLLTNGPVVVSATLRK